MSSGFLKVVAAMFGGAASRSKPARLRGGQAPACESLEGRQLLNGSWSGGPPVWMGGNMPPAHFRLDHMGGRHGQHDHMGGPRGQHDHMGGPRGHDMFQNNPTLRADFKTLQTDINTLQSEVPTAVTAQIKADRATIDKALSTLTPAQRQSLHSTSLGSDPGAGLTAALQAANVPTAQINSIVADFQNYKTTLQTIDPALTAKIAADQATIQNDLPAGMQGKPFGGPAGGKFGRPF